MTKGLAQLRARSFAALRMTREIELVFHNPTKNQEA